MRARDLPPLGLPPALVDAPAMGADGPRLDCVPEEVPVALSYNGISHAVMLASPADLEDFALGFSLTEGILARADELFDLEIEQGPAGVVVEMRIAGARFATFKTRRRALAGRTGCGLCGVESLDQVARPLTPLPPGPVLTTEALHRALSSLQAHQPMHARTGGVHAAAWASPDGTVALVREDVGRHNALDKLIGGLAHHGLDGAAGFALVTSRASFEMVQKAAAVGIPLLAAVSAPTGYAIRLAHALNLTLVGFLRAGRHTIYTHPQRLGALQAPE